MGGNRQNVDPSPVSCSCFDLKSKVNASERVRKEKEWERKRMREREKCKPGDFLGKERALLSTPSYALVCRPYTAFNFSLIHSFYLSVFSLSFVHSFYLFSLCHSLA